MYDNDIDDLFYLVRLGFGCETGTGIDRGASATGKGRYGGLSCFILLMYASLKSLQYDLSSFERLKILCSLPPSPQSGQLNFYTPKIHHFGLEEVVVLSDFMGDSFIDASAKEDVGAVVVGKGWVFCCCH